MERQGEVELRVLVAEGILDREEARRLREATERGGKGVLARLRDERRISEATFSSLRLRIEELTLAPGDAAGSQPRAAGDVGEDGVAEAPDAPDALDALAGGDGVAGFPVRGWDRYRPIRLLGQGGMGRVFLAEDLRLHRKVAIKFMLGDDPALARRCLSEAQAQARVDDERVCKVYDSGEVQGHVYIAMQYIDGRALGELVDELTYEQKAMVMRGAALGVNEAHRVGLIHRDLKPSNIMVERGEGGELRPFVMDFGIARDWASAESSTLTGTVLGTPQYMAPEQARGELRLLDRRSDVYSLGATLYALLVGKAPIEGSNPLEVLALVPSAPPPRPRAIDRELPLDLEAIALKCLEKERGARYDSARALADDLGRFLGGEPVAARASAGLGYRLRKWARRRRRLVTALAVALLVLAVALGLALGERRRAAVREVLARRFTERVERVESLARYSALAPAHDVRGDRALIQREMAAIAAEMSAAGALGAGPGRYALGRGQLALGDDDRAEAELRLAWHLGFRQPRAAYALALAEGRLYQRGLRAAEALPRELRPARRDELARRYRDPARVHLLASAGAEVPSRDYVAALLAYYEGRHDRALAALDAIDGAAHELAWFYEAPLLRGQILHARAMASRGEAPPAQIADDLIAARRAFATAAAIGESDPAVFLAAAELEYSALVLEMYGAGEVAAPYQRGVAALDRALAILPAHSEALALRAQLRRALAEHRGNLGEDTTPLLTAAVADAARALELSPASPARRLELSRCYRQWGELRGGRGLDPREQLGQAAELAAAIEEAARGGEHWIHVGLVHKIWADYEDQLGQDSAAHRGLAIDAYRRALALDERLGSAWLNLAINYYARAQQAPAELGAAPDDLALALAALERGRALQPQSLVPDFYAGELYALRARRPSAAPAARAADRALALASYRRGLAINPAMPHLHNGISIVELAAAVEAAQAGGDPRPGFAAAEAAAAQAIAAAPDQVHGHNNLGVALMRRAAELHRRGLDPRALAQRALASITRALELEPEHEASRLSLVELQLLLAELERAAGRDERAAVELARRTLAKVRARNPKAAGLVELERRAAALATRAP